MVDDSGVKFVDSTIIGQPFSYTAGQGDWGQLAFSPNGNQFASVSVSGVVDIFDFDRCSGDITNHRAIHTGDATFDNPFYGCAFSPSGQFLYVSETAQEFDNEIWQIDLSSGSPWATRTKLFSTESTQYLLPGQMKLGPDKLIYCSQSYGVDGQMLGIYNTNLSIISSPDSLGVTCNFIPYNLYVGPTRTYHGLPNTPLYLPRMWKQAADAGPDRELCVDKAESVVVGVPDTSQGRCTFRWEPAEGLTDPNVAQPVASPQDSTMYVLTVTDITVGNSCATTTDTVLVFVKPCPDPPFVYPNVISPNGDGINDRLDIGGVTGSASLSVYDRWGKQLFHADSYQNDWDGRMPGGAQVPDGVYWYVVKPYAEAKPVVNVITVMR